MSISRVLTFLFGAAPTLLWLPLLAIWLLIPIGGVWERLASAEVIEMVTVFAFIAWGMIGLWGTYSLWAAVLGPFPVARSTAYGLGAGIVAMTLTPILGVRDSNLSGLSSFDLFSLWIIAGPVVVASWHIHQCASKKQNP